eukprot:1226540-Pyramimonas_sp.AAC.1
MGLALAMFAPRMDFCEGLACFQEEPWYACPLHTQFGALLGVPALGTLLGRLGCVLGRPEAIFGVFERSFGDPAPFKATFALS